MTIEPSVAPASPGRACVMARLRAGTNDQHRRLHHHPLLAHLLEGTGETARTVRALTAFHRFYRHLEPRLVAATRTGSPGERYARPVRTGWLAADLRRLGHEAAAATPPRWVTEAPLADPAVLAGVLYVIEGSASGGRIIARRSSPDLRGLRYFEGHGAATATRWAATRELIVRLADRRHGDERAIAAARRTFAAIEACLDGVLLEADMATAADAVGDR